jgi:hypothetical protein
LKNPDDVVPIVLDVPTKGLSVNISCFESTSNSEVISDDNIVDNIAVVNSPSTKFSTLPQPTLNQFSVAQQPALAQIIPKESSMSLKTKAGKNDVSKKGDIKKQDKDISKLSFKPHKQDLENIKEISAINLLNLVPSINKVEEIEDKVLG